MVKEFSSEKALQFTESVIREMTRICLKHQGVNLAQGFPDFPAPLEVKEAAIEAIRADFNQYAITWGTINLRQAIAEKFAWYNGVTIDPEREITVCCGSTEAMISSRWCGPGSASAARCCAGRSPGWSSRRRSRRHSNSRRRRRR